MSKEAIVLVLVNLFRRYGYEGASLAQISKVTGLGKASLYHYFPGGKEEMVRAALDYIDNWVETNILKILRSNASPLERLQAMCQQVEVFYDRGQTPCLWAILTLEESSDRFHTRIKQALTVWIEVLADVLKEAGIEAELATIRAQEAILRIQGALILTRGLNDTTPFERTMKSLAEELLS
ncbi:TetR/AcrR family transcriptional regulator [Candidatus Gracilibacteria bacterium]|jgi:TetR/AcrR family transcriptional regulator, lmrAB and yxaGH operons repressor|nr:TetR/AcrR family transcriptional regulator [Candidatus Gracilibacteria bacterium]NJM86285.1 TetR/AcrR family transcriptional regulator [Hydrococcus sp. RU_2_2]NJP18099.1 TetR/AcrR family transcriptional regulator [Hydrococcus sp. CRU_1_1]